VSIDLSAALPRRLHKRIAERLGIPLQDASLLWEGGRVRVITPESDEPRLLSLETLVFEEDTVLLDGVALGEAPPLAYALLNKPKNVTSTTRDPRDKTNLAPYLQAMPPGCFPVGRLDRETTGILLCTNDGDLASAVLRPDHLTTKTYWLWLDEVVEDDDPRLARFVSGVPHNGQLLLAKSARILARSEHSTELELVLTQGRKRQIRLMCRVLGLHLQHLHRNRIGPLTDHGLELGAWRLLSATEVEDLWRAAGGRAEVRRRKVSALVQHTTELRAAGTPHVRLERWLALHAPHPLQFDSE
jgi:pseudouridine synthase